MSHKVLIVDDEEPARVLLQNYVQRMDNLTFVAAASNALAAKKILEQHEIDILLTDIQMDDLTGIDLLRMLKNPPVTVFTTAYSEYALEGYELNVADYLVKPISFPRFCKAMDKCIELIDYQKGITANAAQISTNSEFFFVKTNRKMVKVNYAEILFVESYGEYVKIYTHEDIILALQRTSFMEQMLPTTDFCRIHRSHIVNMNHIKEIDGHTIIIEDHRLVISKRMKEAFLQQIAQKGVI